MNPTLSSKLLNVYGKLCQYIRLPTCKVGLPNLDYSIDFLCSLDAFFCTKCAKGTKHSTWTYLHHTWIQKDMFLHPFFATPISYISCIYVINSKLSYIIHSPVLSHIHVVLAVTCNYLAATIILVRLTFLGPHCGQVTLRSCSGTWHQKPARPKRSWGFLSFGFGCELQSRNSGRKCHPKRKFAEYN